MKIKSIGSALFTGALAAMALALSNVALAASLSLKSGEYVPGEVLVKFKPTVSSQIGIATVSAYGGAIQANLNRNVMHVKLGAGKTVEESIAAYSNDPSVEYAQPN